MEDDFQMLKCLFWQLLQKTEACVARITRRDVEHWCKRAQMHRKQGKQKPERIDTGEIVEPREESLEHSKAYVVKLHNYTWPNCVCLCAGLYTQAYHCCPLHLSFLSILRYLFCNCYVNMLSEEIVWTNMFVRHYGVSETYMIGVKQILSSLFTIRVVLHSLDRVV